VSGKLTDSCRGGKYYRFPIKDIRWTEKGAHDSITSSHLGDIAKGTYDFIKTTGQFKLTEADAEALETAEAEMLEPGWLTHMHDLLRTHLPWPHSTDPNEVFIPPEPEGLSVIA